MVRDGHVWSLAPFRAGFLDAIGAAEPKDGPLDPWLDSSESSDTNLVRVLVRRRVLSTHHRWIAWHHDRHVAYFRLNGEPREWKTVRYRWAKGAGRAVVSPQEAKTRDGYAGYRHDAAELGVRCLFGHWYLEIRPTYLFTRDGVQMSRHHASALKKIKEFDTHPAVSQALRMWAHLFRERMTLDAPADQPLALGGLVELSSPRSIIDRSWRQVSPAELGYVEHGTLSLFDLEELGA